MTHLSTSLSTPSNDVVALKDRHDRNTSSRSSGVTLECLPVRESARTPFQAIDDSLLYQNR